MKAHSSAKRFIEAIQPLADDLKIPYRKKLAFFLISDLGIITRICSLADGVLNNEELKIAVLVLASVKSIIALEKCGPFSTGQEAEHYLDHWDELDLQTRTKVYKSLNKSLTPLLDEHLYKTSKISFQIPSTIQRLDARYGSRYYHSIAAALYRYAQALTSSHKTITKDEEKVLHFLWQKLFLYRKQIPNQKDMNIDKNKSKRSKEKKTADDNGELQGNDENSLDDILGELDNLIGLKKIKKEVHTFVNFLEIQEERTKRGLSETKTSLHSVFYGPPGTGKTTVARLLGQIFKKLGFLEKGHLVETDRAGLVGSYIGHTSEKVDSKITEAMGGVLFIDEAYALKPDEDSGKDFGQEAIDILIKRMEDNRDNLIVIVAGYPDEMKRFIESNPGLKSRFNRYFYFDHYSPAELLAIFNIFCKNANYRLTADAKKKLLALIKTLYRDRDKSFGNGRLSRNLFEKIIERQANRLAGNKELTDEQIIRIEQSDIPGKYRGEEEADDANDIEEKTTRLPEWIKKRRYRK